MVVEPGGIELGDILQPPLPSVPNLDPALTAVEDGITDGKQRAVQPTSPEPVQVKPGESNQ